MSDIYRKASEVVAYLGHSCPYLECFADYPRLHDGKQSLLSSGSCIPHKDAREKDMLSVKVGLGFLHFIYNPYFSRM